MNYDIIVQDPFGTVVFRMKIDLTPIGLNDFEKRLKDLKGEYHQ